MPSGGMESTDPKPCTVILGTRPRTTDMPVIHRSRQR